jgi:hypothetical protein
MHCFVCIVFQLGAKVRQCWRAKMKTHGIIDTNSTTNWRRLFADVRRDLHGRLVASEPCCELGMEATPAMLSGSMVSPQSDHGINASMLRTEEPLSPPPFRSSSAESEITPSTLLQMVKRELSGGVLLRAMVWQKAIQLSVFFFFLCVFEIFV